MIAALALAATLNTLPPATGLRGTWAGPVLNCYSGQCMPGISWFRVDKSGRYHGWTLGKKPGQDCLSYDHNGWTGQLYRLGPNSAYALNDGAAAGYVIQISRDRQTASSTYLGPEAGVIESNHYYRDPGFQPRLLLNLAADALCR